MVGVVMEFHSAMSRMKSTRPDCEDGQEAAEDRQLACEPRRDDKQEQAEAGDRRPQRDRRTGRGDEGPTAAGDDPRRRPRARQARQRSHDERQADRGPDEDAVIAGERRDARRAARPARIPTAGGVSARAPSGTGPPPRAAGRAPKLSGCEKNTADAAGEAASRPAPRRRSASRPPRGRSPTSAGRRARR